MSAKTVELTEAVTGYWRHKPELDSHWYEVLRDTEELDSYCVREYRDGEVFPVQEDVVNTLKAAKDWIRDRRRAKARA